MHLFIYFYVSNKDIRVSKILKDDCFEAREEHTLDIVFRLLIIKNRLKYSCTQTIVTLFTLKFITESVLKLSKI